MSGPLPESFWEDLEADIIESDEQDHDYESELDDLKQIIPAIVQDLPDHYIPQSYEGKGGTGVIIGIEDAVMDDYRALKVPRPIFGMESKVNDILANDFDKLKELSHPNVIDVYYHNSINYNGRNYPYYVMEYIDGNTEVDEYLGGAEISQSDVLETIDSILDAVEYMHKYGIIHQDFKPENILVKTDGTPVIVDLALFNGPRLAVRSAQRELPFS